MDKNKYQYSPEEEYINEAGNLIAAFVYHHHKHYPTRYTKKTGWDSLMTVVAKIEEVKEERPFLYVGRDSAGHREYQAYWLFGRNSVYDESVSGPLVDHPKFISRQDAYIHAVVNFLKWYNKKYPVVWGEDLDPQKLPKYVRLGNHTTMCLTLKSDGRPNVYYRDNGCWSTPFQTKAGELISMDSTLPHLEGEKFTAITEEEWAKENGGERWFDVKAINVKTRDTCTFLSCLAADLDRDIKKTFNLKEDSWSVEVDGSPVTPIKKGDDVMTLEDFRDICSEGGYLDSDGWGYLATKKYRTKRMIVPSDAKDKSFKTHGFTNVVWFNK